MKLNRGLFGVGDEAQGRQSTLSLFPARPARITRLLARLAESNPTPREYEARKREILKEEQNA